MLGKHKVSIYQKGMDSRLGRDMPPEDSVPVDRFGERQCCFPLISFSAFLRSPERATSFVCVA